MCGIEYYNKYTKDCSNQRRSNNNDNNNSNIHSNGTLSNAPFTAELIKALDKILVKTHDERLVFMEGRYRYCSSLVAIFMILVHVWDRMSGNKTRVDQTL